MIIRLKLTLEQAEYSALLESALADLRNPNDQARFIIRKELEKCGLLIYDSAIGASYPHNRPGPIEMLD